MTSLVIGAGVVGLAVARSLAVAARDVIVAEAAQTIGSGVSSRNSEVVHAGMYYPPGSLRAEHCMRGRRLLYAYCDAHGVAFRTSGKLIVATSQPELRKLEGLYRQGLENGVESLALLDGVEASRREPELTCLAALESAETGIVDSHGLMLALRGDIEDHGGMIAFNARVESFARVNSQWRVRFADGECVDFDEVVNCAALEAQALASRTDGFPIGLIPQQYLAKGSFFTYAGRPVFSRLIYPAPVDGGLGTHVTLDLTGRMKFGPDVEWIDEISYDVDPRRADGFYAAIRRYWPGLPDGSLQPDYAGVRPKLSGAGMPPKDFVVAGPADHGLPGHVALFGIESPGLTASLSLAQLVLGLLDAETA